MPVPCRSRRSYFYPRPPRGGRPRTPRLTPKRPKISIHALREEGDTAALAAAAGFSNFYPRPPRGGRHDLLRDVQPDDLFLSTPSARRATVDTITKAIAWKFLSTPSARRATQAGGAARLPGEISIHALREEGDGGQFRRSLGRRISIHALREEGDAAHAVRLIAAGLFLSTPSARRATSPALRWGRRGAISIHALREEGDQEISKQAIQVSISIHALREEGDFS